MKVLSESQQEMSGWLRGTESFCFLWLMFGRAVTLPQPPTHNTSSAQRTAGVLFRASAEEIPFQNLTTELWEMIRNEGSSMIRRWIMRINMFLHLPSINIISPTLCHFNNGDMMLIWLIWEPFPQTQHVRILIPHSHAVPVLSVLCRRGGNKGIDAIQEHFLSTKWESYTVTYIPLWDIEVIFTEWDTKYNIHKKTCFI